ncbi:hypothetical protein ACFFLM_00745, partial [Deinococcus oregonensis]
NAGLDHASGHKAFLSCTLESRTFTTLPARPFPLTIGALINGQPSKRGKTPCNRRPELQAA